MSLPKEPRQKMINMMYLVLTALLALNVSAEIINAFKTVDNSLVKSNSTLTSTSSGICKALQDARTDPKNARPPQSTLQGLVEAEYPNAFFVVREYIGFDDKECEKTFEQRMKQWPTPALAMPIQSTTLERDMRQCRVESRDTLRFPETMPKRLQDLLRAQGGNDLFGGDAILFVTSAQNMTESPMLPDLYLDLQYRDEIKRRAEIQTGQPLPDSGGGIVPITPVD